MIYINKKSNIIFRYTIFFLLILAVCFGVVKLSHLYLAQSQRQHKLFVEQAAQLNDLRIDLVVLNQWQKIYIVDKTEREKYLSQRKILVTIDHVDQLKTKILNSEYRSFEIAKLKDLLANVTKLVSLNNAIIQSADTSDTTDLVMEYRSLYNVVDYMISNLIKESIIVTNRINTKKLLNLILTLCAVLLALLITVLALFFNIHKQRRTELLLKKTKSYLNNVINSMPSMLVGLDSQGKIININKESESVCNLSSKQVEGRAFVEIFPEFKQYINEIKDTVRQKKVLEKTKIPYLISGTVHRVNLTAYPLITNGIEGAVLRIDDVTKKVRMEEMMIQTEKMTSLGGLAAGIAHEVNNPLAAMLQTSQVVLDRLSRDDIPANVKEAQQQGISMAAINNFMYNRNIIKMLSSIHESGKRVASIVENMLNFARSGSENFDSYDVTELIEKTLELATVDYNIKKKYDFRTITIKKEFDEYIPLLQCDLGLLQQVLLNIFQNAAQAMQHCDVNIVRPVITISAHYDVVRSNIVVKISDNGPGMDDETCLRLFEPFFTTKDTGVGTGLGMSVSYFIIKDYHNGDLTVESELGKGTTFTITLPAIRT